MVEYQTLQDLSPEELLASFNRAFSDYAIPMNLDRFALELFLRRKGYVANQSFGAYVSHELVGFILNGSDDVEGAYVIAMGIDPKFRGLKLGKALIDHSLALLKKQQVRQYSLEVISDNASAINLYQKSGFQISRSFVCFKIAKDDLVLNVESAYKLRLCPLSESAIPFDMRPSWQNSTKAVQRVAERMICLSVGDAKGILGFGIIDIVSGDISQLLVHPDHRRQGIASALLDGLKNQTQAATLSLVNVDAESFAMLAFLAHCGFTKTLEQYEMTLDLVY